MDPKIVKLMNLVGVENINQFRSMEKISAVKALQDCYSKSTMEDLLWRLIRELQNTPDFPKRKITEYRKLWKSQDGLPKSKKKPTGNPVGRPPGVKNKCDGEGNVN
jgi:hypothetical protein